MSTAARKARKRAHLASLAAGIEYGRFHHPVKTGTPVPLRSENQSRPYHISATISGNRPTAKARKRLEEYEARTSAAAHGTPWPDHRRASRA